MYDQYLAVVTNQKLLPTWSGVANGSSLFSTGESASWGQPGREENEQGVDTSLPPSLYKSLHNVDINLVSKQKGLFCTIPERGPDGNFLDPNTHINRARRLHFESSDKCLLPHVREAALKYAKRTCSQAAKFRREQLDKWWKVARDLRKAGKKHNPNHAFYVDVLEKIDEEMDLLNRGPARFRDGLNVCKMAS